MEHPDLEPEDQLREPRNLRFLRQLVTGLTLIMVVGVLLILVLIVMRFRAVPPPLPEQISLPPGTTATGFTQGDNWFAVTTSDNTILIFDRVTGALLQTIEITSGS